MGAKSDSNDKQSPRSIVEQSPEVIDRMTTTSLGFKAYAVTIK